MFHLHHQSWKNSATWAFSDSEFCSQGWEPPATGYSDVRACSVANLYVTLCHHMDCSHPGFSVHGISQGRILEWVVVSCSMGSSWPRDWTCVSSLAGRFFTTEPPGKPCIDVEFTIKWILRKKKFFCFLHWLASDHLVLLVFGGILLFLLNENLHILASEKPEKLEDLYACLPLHPRFTESVFGGIFFFLWCFFFMPPHPPLGDSDAY